jgi:hypothetical protein
MRTSPLPVAPTRNFRTVWQSTWDESPGEDAGTEMWRNRAASDQRRAAIWSSGEAIAAHSWFCTTGS